MTQYYPDVLDEKGVLHYGYFDAYFTDPTRKAFFLYDGDVLPSAFLLALKVYDSAKNIYDFT